MTWWRQRSLQLQQALSACCLVGSGTAGRTQYDELAELATMCALAKWLRRWQPIAIHGAILACARPEAVAGAIGDSIEAAYENWHEWAIVQRDNIAGGRPGITGEEYDEVVGRFASAGSRASS